MITPSFELSQDPDYLILSIRVPYTRTSEFDLYIDGVDFKFYAKPYFLRLTLPGKIVEDGREKGSFDIDKGLFTLRVPKETSGENFEGLQMLTSLLAPKGSRSAKPLVEDLSMEASSGDMGVEGEEEEEDDFDWEVEQQVFMECSEEELQSLHRYGFGNQRSGVFTRLQEELCDVIDVKNPEGTSAVERRQARLESEAFAFCHDHYLADLFEDEEIQSLLKFHPWWSKLGRDDSQEGEAAVSFADDEKEQLRKFTNRSYVLGKLCRQQVWLGLADLLLAYSYAVRATEGEHNVESPWTIRKLSGTLSWLETYTSLQEVLVSFGRRVLCYPLYRHFSLVTAAVRDTTRIFQSGKACVLKCLLDIHRVFRENDPAYILNDLYITDYCVWIQKIKSRKVTALADALGKISLGKKDLSLELEELEMAAGLVEAEEQSRREGRGHSGGAPKSRGVEESDSDDSSSSDSSDESEDCEPEGKDRVSTTKGGGGGGGEMAEAKPLLQPQLQPEPTSPALPAPASSSLVPGDSWVLRQPGALSSPVSSSPAEARGGSFQLIQELGEMVEEGLWISQAQSPPEAKHSSSSGRQAQPEINGSQSPAVAQAATGTLLEVRPRRNPLLIVQTDNDDDDDIDEDDYIS